MSIPPPSPPEFDHLTSMKDRNRMMSEHATQSLRFTMSGGARIPFDPPSDNWSGGGSSSRSSSGSSSFGSSDNSFGLSPLSGNDIFTPPPSESYGGEYGGYGGYSEGWTEPAKPPMTPEEKEALAKIGAALLIMTPIGAALALGVQFYDEYFVTHYPAMSVYQDMNANTYAGYGETSVEAERQASQACENASSSSCGEIVTYKSDGPSCLALAPDNRNLGYFKTEYFSKAENEKFSVSRIACSFKGSAALMPNGQCATGPVIYHCNDAKLQQEARQRGQFAEETLSEAASSKRPDVANAFLRVKEGQRMVASPTDASERDYVDPESCATTTGIVKNGYREITVRDVNNPDFRITGWMKDSNLGQWGKDAKITAQTCLSIVR